MHWQWFKGRWEFNKSFTVGNCIKDLSNRALSSKCSHSPFRSYLLIFVGGMRRYEQLTTQSSNGLKSLFIVIYCLGFVVMCSAQNVNRDEYFFKEISQNYNWPKVNYFHLTEGNDGTIWSNTDRGVSIFDGLSQKITPINPNGAGNKNSHLVKSKDGRFACINSQKSIVIISPNGDRATFNSNNCIPEELAKINAPSYIYDMAWGAQGALHLVILSRKKAFLSTLLGDSFRVQPLTFKNYPFGVMRLDDGTLLSFQNQHYNRQNRGKVMETVDNIVYLNPEVASDIELQKGLGGATFIERILKFNTTLGIGIAFRNQIFFQHSDVPISLLHQVNDVDIWQGQMFVSSAGGLTQHNLETREEKLLFQADVITHMHDRSGNIYLSPIEGTIWIGKPSYFQHIPNQSHKGDGFADMKTYNGRLYLTMVEKFYEWENGHPVEVPYLSAKRRITDYSLEENGDGYVLRGGSIYKVNSGDRTTKKMAFNGKSRFAFAKRIAKLGDGHFALGGPNTVAFLKNDTFLYASGSNFGRQPKNPKRFSTPVQTLAKWTDSTVFISGESGTYLMDINTHTWKRYKGIIGQSDVTTVIRLDDTTIYATYGKGLLIETTDTGVIQLTSKQGLNSDFLNTMTYHDGKLYIASEGAVNVVDLQKDLEVSEYNKPHGIPNTRIFDIHVYNDTLFVSSDDGIFFNDLSKFLPDVSDDNPWHIKAWINGQNSSLENLKNVDGARNVEIEAYPIAPHLLGGVRVKYRLTESAEEFRDMKNNLINLSLSPGEYELTFRAIHEFSPSPLAQDITIPIHVKARFYETTTFGIVASLLSIFLIYLYFARVVYRLRQRNLLQTQLIEVEQHALKSQMNPHFMFNSLNAIQGYVSKQDKMSAFTYIAKFSRLIRWYLDNTTQKDVPIIEEVNALRDYLDLESMRFNKSFEYRIDISQDAMENKASIRFPNMMLQPTIENSILHGIRYLEKNGLIKIEVSLNGHFVRVAVEDNGIGRKQSHIENMRKQRYHRSVASANVSRRTELINKQFPGRMKYEVVDLETADGKPKGTRVVFEYKYMEG